MEARTRFLYPCASLRGSAQKDILPDRNRGGLGAVSSVSMLQDILDWSVAEGDLPFVFGLVGDRNGVRCSGSASEASPLGRAAEDALFRIFSISTSIFATAAMILVDRGKLNAYTSAEDIVRKWTCQRQDRSNADVPEQDPLPPVAPFSLEWSPSTRN